MSASIVVAFRMSPVGMVAGPEGTYLERARSMCVRGEALGGRLVAWSASVLAMGWELDSVEHAILFAASIREEALSAERAWASGVAQGELESLSPSGQGILGWGPALLSAATLAKMAGSGEVLVDALVASARGGRLALLGVRDASPGGHAMRGWLLDVEHPWLPPTPSQQLRAAAEAAPATTPELRVAESVPPEALIDESELDGLRMESIPPEDHVDESALLALFDESALGAGAASEAAFPAAAFAAPPPPPAEFRPEAITTPLPSADFRAAAAIASSPPPADPLRARIRNLALGAPRGEAIGALAELWRTRSTLEGGPARCQASLARALMLSLTGRAEDALLESLDALARAQESHDPRAVGACMALLAKLYAGVGHADAATALRQSATSI